MARVDGMQALLTREEQGQARAFHFARDQTRFVIRRGILRLLLGKYLDLDAKWVPLTYNRFGKPAVVIPGARSLNFSVSHSDGQVVYAIGRDRRIGVDIERLRPMEDLRQIASRFYSTMENDEIQRLPPIQQGMAFFYGWTRKEAYLKAKGVGLQGALSGFSVSLSPGRPARLLRVDNDMMATYRWQLVDLDCPRGYAAALCIER